ncbi:potassium-transporting ATPase subunit C [Actinopolymorpha pittospori]|uniref:Potassium-transporting ATPase KdpC subunit n=1 Tax=Actinopolymorpha pittospori TaxID=648752 RepID=A0A927MXC5_9ACTN|nr:potassium-transporting ATPase subunit C [Actinopolymorpha pittospori]MBE1606478.1 K+-transporting ATPase ATPase C chain [Actinopolymorpha pittospori]
MLLNLRRAIIVSLIFFVLLGLAYPLLVTGIGQAFLGDKANGSLTEHGSTLIGQEWSGPQWFHGRADGFDPTATGGSNLGPRSKELLGTYKERIAALEKQGTTPTQDLVSASGSGVDPDISPDAAYAQAATVAKARGLSVGQVRALIASHVSGPQFGFLGAPHINVLQLNEALAELT